MTIEVTQKIMEAITERAKLACFDYWWFDAIFYTWFGDRGVWKKDKNGLM